MTQPSDHVSAQDQPLEERVENRSHRPSSDAFKEFMGSHWQQAEDIEYQPDAAAACAAQRRVTLSQRFPTDRLALAAGAPKLRSSATDPRFRPHSAFAHLTGLGVDHEPDAVLVMQPVAEGTGDHGSNHQATLYFRPLAGRDSEEFYANTKTGEFWVGPLPTLKELHQRTGIQTQDLNALDQAVTADNTGTRIRLVRNADQNMDAMVDTARIHAKADLEESDARDAELAEFLSEMRLIKDEYEIAELRGSVESTIRGFEDIVRAIPQATQHTRGERVIETAFFARARLEGNDLGYDTIAAGGNNATEVHLIRHTGPVNDGELVLVDAGGEADSLYTADITRTMPVNGKFSPVQAKIYNAVLAAADAALAAVKPGVLFRDIHNTAMEVLARHLDAWGLLPVSLEEALSPEGQHHRRWMPHGTSHHLGLDVHDCAQARREMYLDAPLEEGMVFTIEPGLYFKQEDLAIPEEYRGIGIRIEDDILVTANGGESLSAHLPRTVEDIEAWMQRLWQG